MTKKNNKHGHSHGANEEHSSSHGTPSSTTTTTSVNVSHAASLPPQTGSVDQKSVNSFTSTKSHAHDTSHGHGHSQGNGGDHHGHSHSHHGNQPAQPLYQSYQQEALAEPTTSFSHQQYPSPSGSNMHSHIVCSHTQIAPDCGHNECQPEEDPKRTSSQRVLRIVTALCFFFMCVELIGGYVSGSLAIMTDAAHLLSDLVSFMISLMSLQMATKSPNSSMTFGYHRAEILGALISVFLIWGLTVVLVWESINRILNPGLIDVNAGMMLIVAIIGFIVNIIMGLVLLLSGEGHNHSHGGLPSSHGHSHGHDEHHHSDDEEEDEEHGHSHGSHSDDDEHHGHSHDHEEKPLIGHGKKKHHHDDNDNHGLIERFMELILPKKSKRSININAAILHVLGDLMQSVGVIIAALVIWFIPSWKLADPLCTLLFSVIVITTTMRVMKQGVRVLMEGTPDGIDSQEVAAALQSIPSVIAVHDLHIWSLSVDQPALAVHLVVAFKGEDNGSALAESPEEVLNQVNDMLQTKYHISHTTIQLEEQFKTGVCVPKAVLCKKPSTGEINLP